MRLADARRLVCYIAHNYLQVPQASVARAAGMSKAAVCTAVKDIEEARERGDYVHEAFLRSIEEAFG